MNNFSTDYVIPEQDEQGTFYGYKVLVVDRENFYDGRLILISPLKGSVWGKGGELASNRVPLENTPYGIHFVKEPFSNILKEYIIWIRLYARTYRILDVPVIVQCALSGTVIETEKGFRAQYAQIVALRFETSIKSLEKYYGNWQSYQEACEYTKTCPPSREGGRRIYASYQGVSSDSYFSS